MKPLQSLLSLALSCGCALGALGGAEADPLPRGLQLAQAPPPDKNGDADKQGNKQGKDNKGPGKGHDGRGPGGDKGPKGKPPGPPPEQKKGPQQQQQQKPISPPPVKQVPKVVPPKPPAVQHVPKVQQPPQVVPPKPPEVKPAPKVQAPPPQITPPEPDDKNRNSDDRRDGPDRNGRDDHRGPDKKGPEQKAPEFKAPEQKGPPPGGTTAPQTQKPPEAKPLVVPSAPPPAGPKDADHKDRERRDNDRKDAERKGGDGKDRDWKKDADRDRGPPGGGPGRPERGRWTGGKPPVPTEARDINDLKTKRREHAEDGGKRVVIEEPDKRRIIREGGRTIIRHDETERFRRIAPDTRHEKKDGLNISVSILPGGIRIFTDLDDDGRPLRRYRRGADGRDTVLFDNRDYYRRSRGGSFLDAIIDLAPPRIRIPREQYIVEYDRASDEDIYDALDAGPVDDLDRGYSLEEVRYSPMLRDRMRRIDLDTVNFEFGSWTVEESQYGALERVARAMNRIIDRNPGEMFLIEGHTDAVGSDDDNLSLSDRRAESVAIILTEEFGVPPENLTTQGYGEQYLKVPTDGPERLNRRVAVRRITPLLAR